MAIAYLGLGSNLGAREENLQKALTLLNNNAIEVLQCSSFLETEPVNCPEGSEKFLNGAIKVKTDLSPEKLLETIHTIEEQLGRIRSTPNAPRTIDIDILLYNDVSINTTSLVIPHPRMQERDFVMQPLKEIQSEESRV